MMGHCAICGLGLAAHHETTTTSDGRAHATCAHGATRGRS